MDEFHSTDLLYLTLLSMSVCVGTWPVQEGSVLPGHVPQPHSLSRQLLQADPGRLSRCLRMLVLLLEQQRGHQHPRLQHHVLLLGPDQPEGRVVHETVDVLARPPGDVSAGGGGEKETKCTTDCTEVDIAVSYCSTSSYLIICIYYSGFGTISGTRIFLHSKLFGFYQDIRLKKC